MANPLIVIPALAAVKFAITYIVTAKNKEEIDKGIDWAVTQVEAIPVADELTKYIADKLRELKGALPGGDDLDRIKEVATATLNEIEEGIRKAAVDATEGVRVSTSDALRSASKILSGFARDINPDKKKKKKGSNKKKKKKD